MRPWGKKCFHGGKSTEIADLIDLSRKGRVMGVARSHSMQCGLSFMRDNRAVANPQRFPGNHVSTFVCLPHLIHSSCFGEEVETSVNYQFQFSFLLCVKPSSHLLGQTVPVCLGSVDGRGLHRATPSWYASLVHAPSTRRCSM